MRGGHISEAEFTVLVPRYTMQLPNFSLLRPKGIRKGPVFLQELMAAKEAGILCAQLKLRFYLR